MNGEASSRVFNFCLSPCFCNVENDTKLDGEKSLTYLSAFIEQILVVIPFFFARAP